MTRKFGYRADGSKQAKEGCKTCFGNTIRPVGYEREVKGYIIVKTALYPTVPSSKDNWKLKHVHVWEQTNNKRLPKGWIVRFKDGNNRNFDPSNLCALPRGLNTMVNSLAYELGVEEMTAETFDVLLTYAKVKKKAHERELDRPRKCLNCGKLFVPDKVKRNFMNCRECLDAGKKHRKGCRK
jgi:predicted Zn-ribbon and HTH transcriptional regulator